MKLNLSQLQTDFWSRGYTIIDNLFPAELLEKWKSQVEFLSKYCKAPGINHIEKEFKDASPEARDGIGKYKFTSLDGRIIFADDLFSGIQEYYHSISNFLSLLTGLDLVESFDKQSSISFMNYTVPGGCIAPHFDSNGVTFLLYLTDNEDGGTKILPINKLRPTILGQADEVIGEPEIILPKCGRAVIFQSRKLWHESMSVFKSNKISSVWNFYERGDNWRPKEVSDRLYS